MGSDWEVLLLGENCTKIGSGATPRGGSKVYLTKGEVALIRSQNVLNREFSRKGLVYISLNHAEQLSNVEVERNDVLLNITGDSVARCCQVVDDVLPARVNQHVAIIRPVSEKLDPQFLRYYLVSPRIQSQMLSWACSGGTRNALTKVMIESFKITAPNDIKEQRAIAHILGSLDDKIELNRRMNETLEAMARTISKSWFVDFDPVYAKAEGRDTGLPAEIAALFPDRFEDSELGEIPTGWMLVSLSEVFTIIGGGTPKTNVKEYWGGDILWFSVVDAPGETDIFVIDTEKQITPIGVDKSSTKVLRKGTTIISARGTVGKCALVGRPMAMNQSCYGIQGKDGVGDYFVYFTIRRQVADLQRSGHGSVFNTITRDTFNTIRIVCPPAKLSISYDEILYPIMESVLANINEIKTLTALRDTLLPKLISGELHVPDVKKFSEEIEL